MRKDGEKFEEATTGNGRKSDDATSQNEKKIPAKLQSDEEPVIKTSRSHSNGIKITIRTNSTTGKTSSGRIEKKKMQDPLFQNQATQSADAVHLSGSEDVTPFFHSERVQPLSPTVEQSQEKITNALQKITALSQSLHEENQVNDHQVKKKTDSEVLIKSQTEKSSMHLKKNTEPVIAENTADLQPTVLSNANVTTNSVSEKMSAEQPTDLNHTPFQASEPNHDTPQAEMQQLNVDLKMEARLSTEFETQTKTDTAGSLPSVLSEESQEIIQPDSVTQKTVSQFQKTGEFDKPNIGAPGQNQPGSSDELGLKKAANPEQVESTKEEKKYKQLAHILFGPRWVMIGIGVFLMLAFSASLGGWLTYRWYDANNAYKKEVSVLREKTANAEKAEQKLNLQLDESYQKLNNIQLGLNQMNKLFEESGAAPDKPQYQKTKQGMVVYWIDGMLWRRYHLYQARGKNEQFTKVNKRSTKKPFYYLADLKPGTWRYAVTAVDREGKETELSEVLEIKISP